MIANPTPAEPIIYQDRWEVVLDGMRQMILNGELEPGSKIRETELAEHFRVSRGPIRESLRALEATGLVVREPRRGSRVIPLTAASVEEIYSLRQAVETLAVRRALALDPAWVVRELEDRLSDFETAVVSGDTSQIVEADIRFHETFYRGADHQRLLSVWESFNDPLRIMMRLSTRRMDPAWRETNGGHLAILDAARAGDADACVVATLTHLQLAESTVAHMIGQ